MTAAAALQAFITYLHHQREFADYMYSSVRYGVSGVRLFIEYRSRDQDDLVLVVDVY